MRQSISGLLAGIGLSLIASTSLAEDYVLNTASTGGTYHPVGVAISTLSKVKLLPKEGFSLTAVNSAGSGANVQALAAGTADFAILQGLFGKYATEGTGPVATPQDNLRSVTMLWPNVEQFVIESSKATNGDMSDVVAAAGDGAGFGKQNSGTLGSNSALLSGLGLDIESDFSLLYAGYGPTAEAMLNGQVSVVGLSGGTPTGAVTKLFATAGDRVTRVHITDEQLEKMDAGLKLWTRHIVPAGTYPGQDSDWETAAQPNFLAVNDTVSEEHVYLLVKTMYENLEFLGSIHPATKTMSLEVALSGLPAPLHPGAQRFYEEQGVTIPEHLIAQ